MLGFDAPLLGIEWIWHLQGSPFKQTMAWLMRCRRYEGGSGHVEVVLSALRFIYHLSPTQGCRSACCLLRVDRYPNSLFCFFFIRQQGCQVMFRHTCKEPWMAVPWAGPGLGTVALVVQQREHSKRCCQWRWLAAVKQRGPLVSRLLLLCVFREWLIHSEGKNAGFAPQRWSKGTLQTQKNTRIPTHQSLHVMLIIWWRKLFNFFTDWDQWFTLKTTLISQSDLKY